MTQGRQLGTRTISNTPEGWAEALAWARGKQQQQHRRWGIENGGSLGKGFAQFLLAQGEADVREVSPQRTAQYRRRGRTQDKTDQADALAIARLLLAEGAHLPTIPRDDGSTELRLLSDHRDNLLVDRTRLINQLHAQMLQIDPGYQARSGALTARRGLLYCRDLTLPEADGVTLTRLLIVRQLVGQILGLEEEIATITAALGERVRASRTPDPRAVRGRRGDRRAPPRRVGHRPPGALRRRAGRAGGYRAGRGLVGRSRRFSPQPRGESPTQPGHPLDGPQPAPVRSARTSLLREETSGGEDRVGRRCAA